MKRAAVALAASLFAYCLASSSLADPPPAEPAPPGKDLRRMQPGFGLPPLTRKQPAEAMPPDEVMDPAEAPPVMKGSPAAQVVFRDFYRVDEPITQERLDEIAPPLPSKRTRPKTRPLSHGKAESRPGKPIFAPNPKPKPAQ